MASVTFSPSVGGDGSTVTDDSNVTTGLANGGHRTRFVPALSQTVAVAANTVTKATEALNSATSAANYATKTDGFASGSDNSAKSWAVGGTGSGAPTAGNAKDWATKTSGNVDGSEFSSKEYAVGTNIRGVAGKGSAKDWATYTGGTVDGTEYSAKKYAQDAAVLFDQFDDKYLCAKASDPTLDNDGNPLQIGSLYWNTTTPVMRVYNGSAWQDAAGAVNVDFSIYRQSITATEGQTIFTLSTAYTPGVNSVAVYVNGVRQFGTAYSETNSTTITFSSGLTAGDVVLFEQGYTVTGPTTTASLTTFTPSGNISSGNVQAAISELDSEKQGVLVSGTNIKTINSTSLLGSGDVAVQTPLVSGTNIKTINGGSILGSGDITAGASVSRSARTSNTILAAGDKGAYIDVTSGTFSQTFTAAATLGSGWFCYVGNSGTGFVTLDPNGSETITREGVALTTWVLWPKEICLLTCDGTGFYYINLQKGEITQTVSSAVASVNFATGMAYRKRLSASVENLAVGTNSAYVNIKVDSANSSSSTTLTNRNGTPGSGNVNSVLLIGQTNGLVANGSGNTKARACLEIYQGPVEVVASYSSILAETASVFDYETGVGYWAGSNITNMSSLSFVTNTGNITTGTFSIREL